MCETVTNFNLADVVKNSAYPLKLFCAVLTFSGIPVVRNNPHPRYMVCGDPELGTDHSLKKVSACLFWHKVDTALGYPS